MTETPRPDKGEAGADRLLREHVLYLLRGGGAHLPVEKVLGGVPLAAQGSRPPGLPHSPWEILEHLRITQSDILEYIRDPEYRSPEWPSGYWPESATPPDAQAWKRSSERFLAGLRALEERVEDSSGDLLAQIQHGEKGHTLLREALLAADHNAYHAAEMVATRRLLGVWE